MDAALHAHPFAPAPARPAASGHRTRSLRPGAVRLPVRCRPLGQVPVLAVVLAVGVVAIVVVTSLRLSQSPPADGTWQDVIQASAADPAPVANPGDQVVIIAPGDTLWAIAQRLAPGEDPRPLVAALTRANGGTLLQVGQQVVIPAGAVGG